MLRSQVKFFLLPRMVRCRKKVRNAIWDWPSANVACRIGVYSQFHPWPLTTMLIQLYTFCFWGDDGALLNIALRGGMGALCTTTLMSGHRCIQTINMLRTVFRHLSKTHIREYAFVAVALSKSRPMHQGTRFKRWPSLHTLRSLPNTSASRRGRQHAPKTIQAAAAAATDVG